MQTEFHERRVESDDPLSLGKIKSDVVGSLAELLLLVIFPCKSLNDTHAADILFDRLVHLVVLLEYGTESRHRKLADNDKSDTKNRNYDNECRGKRTSEYICHDYRENEHERRSYRNTDEHHVRVLDRGDIRRHSRNE